MVSVVVAVMAMLAVAQSATMVPIALCLPVGTATTSATTTMLTVAMMIVTTLRVDDGHDVANSKYDDDDCLVFLATPNSRGMCAE
eukprot:5316663-Pyramimonas_sp.AAC.1